MSGLAELRREILRDVLKCSYCAMCEWVCPTLDVESNNRLYGPRGRVNLIASYFREGVDIGILKESIYTCLVCMACTRQCPAGIDIAEDIRKFRLFLDGGNGVG